MYCNINRMTLHNYPFQKLWLVMMGQASRHHFRLAKERICLAYVAFIWSAPVQNAFKLLNPKISEEIN